MSNIYSYYEALKNIGCFKNADDIKVRNFLSDFDNTQFEIDMPRILTDQKTFEFSDEASSYEIVFKGGIITITKKFKNLLFESKTITFDKDKNQETITYLIKHMVEMRKKGYVYSDANIIYDADNFTSTVNAGFKLLSNGPIEDVNTAFNLFNPLYYNYSEIKNDEIIHPRLQYFLRDKGTSYSIHEFYDDLYPRENYIAKYHKDFHYKDDGRFIKGVKLESVIPTKKKRKLEFASTELCFSKKASQFDMNARKIIGKPLVDNPYNFYDLLRCIYYLMMNIGYEDYKKIVTEEAYHDKDIIKMLKKEM